MQAQAASAARQVIADSLFDHMARGERARIARELHDVVAHHISMIAVQAETARLATPGMPRPARRGCWDRQYGAAGLTEMRRLLGVLREDARAASPDQLGADRLSVGGLGADRHPQPGLGQLGELIDEAREASGTGTRFIVSGAPVTLDPGVELAAYRVVQEALTNARRHARVRPSTWSCASPTTRCGCVSGTTGPVRRRAGPRFRSRRRPRAATGCPACASGPPRGGELRTGAAPGGGFLIEATLPAKAEVG